MAEKKYDIDKNVLDAARERISYIFDEFDNIIVSISGGKDSTVLAYLSLLEAHKRNRKIGLFFLDEEVVYKSTIEQIEYLMDLFPENTIRYWLQIPFNLTNATSYKDSQVKCWDPTMKSKWMHERSDKNVLTKTWIHKTRIADKNKGFGFYDVLYNFELSFENTAFLIGLRSDESLSRYVTMIRNPGYKDVYWSTKRKGTNYSFYPIYDWKFSDIWKYIGENNIRYHRFYDFAYLKGMPTKELRVSSLTHEKAFKAIQILPEFEFDTYEKLLARIGGVSFAQETARDKKMFKVQKLPKNYSSWREYRDFLLKTYPIEEHKKIFEKRFAKHLDNEYVAKQQCKQLVLGDYENNFPISNIENPAKEKTREKINKWKEIL